METTVGTRKNIDRRSFIGGSDARIIMRGDEIALTRLWREKRGEVDPEDLEAFARYLECWRDDLGDTGTADEVRAFACRRIAGMRQAGRLSELEANRWNRRFAC